MKPLLQRTLRPASRREARRAARGSILIIVLWICLGLVALTLYFANSMSTELRAADNRVCDAAAREAVAAGTRYAAYILTQYATGGRVPLPEEYRAEALPVGEATFWFVGRDNDSPVSRDPYFGLIDESSKFNINSVRRADLVKLASLPGFSNLTEDLADSIIAWRNANSQTAASGNADNNYARLDPPRRNKGANFETVDELRLVYGMTLDILFGEDTNRNGALDANEDDGETLAPRDNQDGLLQPGLVDICTVYSRLPATSASGQRRLDIRNPQTRQPNQIRSRLQARGIEQQRIVQIMSRIGDNEEYNSVAAFMLDTQMTADEWALVHTEFTATATTNGTQVGLINVNTASETVLSLIPGIGIEYASSIVAYRLANPDVLTSFAWLTQVLPAGSVRQAGPYITDQSYQFSADIVGVGPNGRGYARERVVFDLRSGTPRIIYRQDLSAAGWALGLTTRQNLTGRRDT